LSEFRKLFITYFIYDLILLGKKSSGMGITTLVVLICLILVGAITAYVLITNQYQQQEDCINTATIARKEVTTQVELFELTATDGRDGKVDYFKYNIRLKPGAEPIRLDDVVIYMNTYNDTLRLIKKEGSCTRDVTNGFFTYR